MWALSIPSSMPRKITGIRKVHAIMGGFHLTGAKEELIQRTVADIKAMNSRLHHTYALYRI